MKKINFGKLISAVLICEGVGVLGAVVTIPSVNSWYQTLNKPSFSPPNFLFGPVWTALYLLMGVSLYLVWTKKKDIRLFWIQLGLNLLWSFLFFGLHSPILGLLDIMVLFVIIILTIKKFYDLSHFAGLLLFPYLIWVSFAILLNLSLVLLNP